MVPAAAGSNSLGLKDALPLTVELECASMLLQASAVRNPWPAYRRCQHAFCRSSEQEV